MVTLRIETTSPAQTARIGRSLGLVAGGGEILALMGELGVGKTVLVRGLARGLGVESGEPVTSPTFVLQSEYCGRLRLFHLDAYRLLGADEFALLGALPDPSERAAAVVAIEWADRVAPALPQDRVTAQLEHVDPTRRRIALEAQGPGAAGWLEAAIRRMPPEERSPQLESPMSGLP